MYRKTVALLSVLDGTLQQEATLRDAQVNMGKRSEGWRE